MITQVPFDDRRLLFPPAPAAIIAAILYSIYKIIFPSWMVSFTAGGTVMGKYFQDTKPLFLLYVNDTNFLIKTIQTK
jgi:hypothetical protein